MGAHPTKDISELSKNKTVLVDLSDNLGIPPYELNKMDLVIAKTQILQSSFPTQYEVSKSLV